MNVEKQSDLTLGEQRYLERAQEAVKEGTSLHAYYRAHGLSLNMLYKVRRQLVAKGRIVAASTDAPVSGRPASKLVEVRLAQRMGKVEMPVAGSVCRLRHPSGWVIECGGWPEPRWLAGLMEARS
jgi:hypothetical protein